MVLSGVVEDMEVEVPVVSPPEEELVVDVDDD